MKKLKLILIFLTFAIASFSQDTIPIKNNIDVDSIVDSNFYIIKGDKLKGLVSLVYNCQNYKIVSDSSENTFNLLILELKAIEEKRGNKKKQIRNLIKKLENE